MSMTFDINQSTTVVLKFLYPTQLDHVPVKSHATFLRNFAKNTQYRTRKGIMSVKQLIYTIQQLIFPVIQPALYHLCQHQVERELSTSKIIKKLKADRAVTEIMVTSRGYHANPLLFNQQEKRGSDVLLFLSAIYQIFFLNINATEYNSISTLQLENVERVRNLIAVKHQMQQMKVYYKFSCVRHRP